MSGIDSGRVAVITGATGGVGAAVARALSKAGYSLVLSAPSMEKLSALAAQLRGPCTVIEGNLSDESLPETLLYAALDRFGHCDICFNNGALFEAGILETVDIERLSSMVRVNVEGSFRVAYVFLKHFVSEGAGHLVNVSSALGSSSRPTAYAATQRAIEVLSEALAAELDDTPVLVSCIQPGLVRTGVRHRWEIGPAGGSGAGYPLEPEDFARMVLFILEAAADQGRCGGACRAFSSCQSGSGRRGNFKYGRRRAGGSFRCNAGSCGRGRKRGRRLPPGRDLKSCRRIAVAIGAAVRTVPASRPTARAALQQVRGSEHHVGPIEVVVFGAEFRCWCRRRFRIFRVHDSILSKRGHGRHLRGVVLPLPPIRIEA